MKKLFIISFVLLCACTNQSETHKHFNIQDSNAKEIHKIAYSLGRQYAVSMREFNFDNESMHIFIQGLKEGHSTDELPSQEMVQYAKKIDKTVQQSRTEKAQEKKSEGEKFVTDLLASDSGPDYKKSASGLIYKILKDGEQVTNITPTAFFSLRYESRKLDDSVYESTLTGSPRKLPIKGVFKAWQEAFGLCGKGCEIEIIAPPSLTYGNNGAFPKIAPGEYLKYKLFFIDYFPQGI